MHLVQKDGIYHLRLRVPIAAQHAFQGRKEIKHSLRTRKKREALPLANQFYSFYSDKLRCILLEQISGVTVSLDQTTLEDQQAPSEIKIYKTKEFVRLNESGEIDFEKSIEIVRKLTAAVSFNPNHHILINVSILSLITISSRHCSSACSK